MTMLQNANAISAGGYDINNSLRFRSSASAYLNRTPASAGNRKTWTWSAWVKRGALNSGGSDMCLFNAGTTSPTYDGFRIKSNTISFFQGGAVSVNIESTQVFRDVSAWYHLVLAVDTTQATAANRVKIYVNGNQVTAFGTANYPALNAEAAINNTLVHNIAAQYANTSSSAFFDGYMTDINFIDGQALEPYFFGNNDANGVWKPIQYRGTYGTNGFYLNFSNTTSTTTLGNDSSGNGNNWTTNNISLTAGVTYDAMTDVPTNTSATTANYATLNPILQNGWWAAVNRGTIQDGNLTFATGAGVSAFSNFDLVGNSGKWYYEMTCSATDTANAIVIAAQSRSTFEVGYYQNGNRQINSATPTAYGASWTSGDVIGVAIDVPNNNITFYKNNTSQGVINNAFPTGQPVYVGAYYNTSSGSYAFNFGQRPFAYTPPTGFVAMNTFNLPTPTILQGNRFMDATTYTGNTGGQSIVNAGLFKPDLIWIKSRGLALDHVLTDSVRGTNKYLVSNNTTAEGTYSTGVTSFNSNGFTLGFDTGAFNGNTTYVGWQWQAGQGSTSSNTSGSITSTVSVNTTAGFSIVTYTGTGANATVGHGLGVAPKMVIVKNRSSSIGWQVRHASVAATQTLELQDTAAAYNSAVWNNTAPTSLVFSLGTGLSINNNGQTYVAYCWAAIPGFSAFGSYVGNGSTNGPFVYTGFRPRFILSKRFDSTGDWWIWDTSRNTFNVVNNFLYPNLSDAEASLNAIDILSNGFKFRNAIGALNASGFNYIYMAFAEVPTKFANAR